MFATTKQPFVIYDSRPGAEIRHRYQALDRFDVMLEDSAKASQLLTFNDLSDRSFKSSFDYTHRQAAKLAKKMG